MAETTGTPPFSEPTRAYGPVEHVDDTRQAQHTMSNDMPTDINFNAIVARSQALTVNVLGKSFEANNDRRTKLFDHFAALLAKPA